MSPDRAASDAPPLNSAELYDYRTDSFIAITNQMITPREEAIASAIPGNGARSSSPAATARAFSRTRLPTSKSSTRPRKASPLPRR